MSRLDGIGRKEQMYLDHKDIEKTLNVGHKKAYEILRKLREESGWAETRECSFINKIVIPEKIFTAYFPNADIKKE